MSEKVNRFVKFYSDKLGGRVEQEPWHHQRTLFNGELAWTNQPLQYFQVANAVGSLVTREVSNG